VNSLSWRPLREADLPALTSLAGACLSADGGQPEDFRADRTLLATVGGADAGFVVAAAGGWIAKYEVAKPG
jgi:hypothetical protein